GGGSSGGRTATQPGSAATQPPTKEDATRRAADAGTGWGSAASYLGQGWDWFRGQLKPFDLENQGAWARLKWMFTPNLDLGSLTPPEVRAALQPPFAPDAPLGEQLDKLPTPFDPIIESVRASLTGDFKTMGAQQLDAFLFTFGPVVKDLAFGD